MNVNTTAFCTISSLGLLTAAGTIATITSASTITAVACGILAISGAALSLASVSAFFDDRSVDMCSYLKNVKSHAGFTLAGMYVFIGQTLVQSLIEGIGNGVSNRISAKLGTRFA